MHKILKSIDSKMIVIIGLLLESKISENDVPEKELIKRLSDLGLNNQGLAKIFNKTTKQVSDQIYKANKSKRRNNNAKPKRK